MKELDGDGYPTEETLTRIKEWEINDMQSGRGLLEFVREIWWHSKWGIHIEEVEDELMPSRKRKYDHWHMSTGGWSGNESIIRAMQANRLFWMFHWVQSRRGGHYIFEVGKEKA
jgi:hypothetical protein